MAALPIYLAGCKELVVLAGPTLVGRMWCLVELFTFLVMGKQEQQVTMIPFGKVANTFESLDALIAQVHRA